jgi:hypothetical protein
MYGYLSLEDAYNLYELGYSVELDGDKKISIIQNDILDYDNNFLYEFANKVKNNEKLDLDDVIKTRSIISKKIKKGINYE